MKTLKITLFLLGITFMGFAQKDEVAIKAVCEKETQSFLDRDGEAMISCHANKAYSLMLVAESGNVHYTTTDPEADVQQATKAFMAQLGKPNGDTFKNSGYMIHLNGSSAFVYFDQTVTAANGTKTYFHEVRNLEKIDGNWKIVYVGAVSFTPEKK